MKQRFNKMRSKPTPVHRPVHIYHTNTHKTKRRFINQQRKNRWPNNHPKTTFSPWKL